MLSAIPQQHRHRLPVHVRAGPASPPLASPMGGTYSLHSSHGRTATRTVIPPFCVCLRNKFCSLETFCA